MNLIHFVLAVFSTGLFYSTAFSAPPSDLQITHYGPQGENTGQVQIQVVFNKPLLPLSTLDDPARKEVISHFHLMPAVDGKFRLIGTSAVVFEPKHHLPLATNFTVKIDPGIKAVDGSILANGIEWSFNTPGPSIWQPHPSNTTHILPNQIITITSNQPLKMDSLLSHTAFGEKGLIKDTPVPFNLEPAKENPKTGEKE